jgi:hypothetical protein
MKDLNKNILYMMMWSSGADHSRPLHYLPGDLNKKLAGGYYLIIARRDG